MSIVSDLHSCQKLSLFSALFWIEYKWRNIYVAINQQGTQHNNLFQSSPVRSSSREGSLLANVICDVTALPLPGAATKHSVQVIDQASGEGTELVKSELPKRVYATSHEPQ